MRVYPIFKQFCHRSILFSYCIFISVFVPSVSNAGPLAVIAVPQTEEWASSWWMERHLEKQQQAIKRQQIDLVFIGDSITHGFEEQGAPVWQNYYEPRNALNLGFSGDRTEHVLWRLQKGALENIKVKLCVLMIGTNNTGIRYDHPADTALGIKTIIETIQNKSPDTKILLLGIFPRGRNADNVLREMNDDVNHIIKDYVDEFDNVYFENINSHFLDQQGTLSLEIMPDLVHPNKKGYEIWAETIEPVIKTLLEE